MKRAMKGFLILMLCMAIFVSAGCQTQPEQATEQPTQQPGQTDTQGSAQDDPQETGKWAAVSALDSMKGFININGMLTRPDVSGGAAVLATKDGNEANQLLCQFAYAAGDITAFEISATVQPGAAARRGVGFKTQQGYLFFNVAENGGENGAGYVWFTTDGVQQTQEYTANRNHNR